MPAVAGLARRIAVARRGQLRHAHRVPFFMDRHEFVGLSAEEAAIAHLKDLKIQGQYGVRFLTYWFDEERQTAFCLAKAPSADAVEEVHRVSHGYMAYQIIEVDESTVARFMGGIIEHPPGEVYVEAAFRTVLFTDIVESTSLTQRLGDAGAMAMVRAHDEIVRGGPRTSSGIGGQAHGRRANGRVPVGCQRHRKRRGDPAAHSGRRGHRRNARPRPHRDGRG
jgi:hypothetical protein